MTLNTFTVANQSNRMVMIDNKVIDYINFILRAGKLRDCSAAKQLELRREIGNLLLSMIEENGPLELLVGREVLETLDKDAIYRVMVECCKIHRALSLKGIRNRKTKKELLDRLRQSKNSMKELLNDSRNPCETVSILFDTGFLYFQILQRLYDIEPGWEDRQEVIINAEYKDVFDFFKKNSMSVEVVKDESLQKINFLVRNKDAIREEVKEKLKWSVDRSSPRNKVQDLVMWSKDILRDAHYQRKILSKPIAMMFTRFWLFWNQLSILLSLCINVIMMWTWNSVVVGDDHGFHLEEMNNTEDEDDFDVDSFIPGTYMPPLASMMADHEYPPYQYVDNVFPIIKGMSMRTYIMSMYLLGGLHNVASVFVFIAYFLSNHPTLPKFKG